MAARTFADWTVENSSTTGTGTYSLGGAPAGTSYFTFRQQYDDGETNVTYWVTNATGTKWEKNQACTLTFGTPDTLTRNVVRSTNGDAAVSWVAGDAPLLIYVVPDPDVQEGVVTGWLATARHALIRFGLWFDEDDVSSGVHTLKLYDGASDIDVGTVDTSAHTLVLEPGLSAWRQLERIDASAVSSVDFEDIPSTINHLMLVFEFDPATDGASLSLQTYGADGVLDSGASDYAYVLNNLTSAANTIAADGTADAIVISNQADNGDTGIGGTIMAANIQASTRTKLTFQTAALANAGPAFAYVTGAGFRLEADRITGIRLLVSSGTITGKATLYGSV